MFRGSLFAVLLQVRDLSSQSSLHHRWEATGQVLWSPRVLLGYLQLCYLSFSMKGCECCETGCGFTLSIWPLKYKKQESVTPPCSGPGWHHYPAKICVVFVGLPWLPWNWQCQETAFPIRLANQTWPSALKKTCPKPQKSLHADLLRSMARASVVLLATSQFLVQGSKDIRRLQDASEMMLDYHRIISL